ncbi:MAG: hypothetical protein ACTSUS_09695 [Candidatus Freyarchaeota archaeon]
MTVSILLVAVFSCYTLSEEEAYVHVRMRAVNLNGEPIANLIIEAYNVTKNNVTREAVAPIERRMTNQTGWAELRLANDTYYTFRAFWKDTQVGILSEQHITSNLTISNFNCSLAHIKIKVMDEKGVPVPFVNLNLTHTYLTRDNQTSSQSILFETKENGTIVASNMLVNANYTIEAKRYDLCFNVTQLFDLEKLLKDGWVNLTVLCPTYSLIVHVVDSKELPIPKARVEVYEWSSRILTGAGDTNKDGAIDFKCMFGRYKVRVYHYDAELGTTVLVNETTVNLVENRTVFTIRCKLYGISPSVRVVDYFGQPIPNVVVKIERKIGEKFVEVGSQKTNSQGITSLPKVGGHYRISTYIKEEFYETRTLYVDATKTIVFRADKYVAFGGLLLDASRLITYTSMGILAAVLGLALTATRISRVFRKRKSPS